MAEIQSNNRFGLKPDGELLACFYIAGEQRVADWLAKTVMTRMGWFTPPFDTANDVRKRLEPYYDILDFHVILQGKKEIIISFRYNNSFFYCTFAAWLWIYRVSSHRS